MADKKPLTRRLVLPAAAAIVVVTIVLVFFCCFNTRTTIMVVRHAEKDTASTLDDNLVPLNAAGVARSQTLSEVAGRAGVKAIFVTEKLRTHQTAQPLADSLGITPTEINKANIDELITAVRDRGGVIVIVGHSDTVPVIVDRLGGGTVTVGEQFDNLFVLSLNRFGTTKLIQATYGEPR